MSLFLMGFLVWLVCCRVANQLRMLLLVGVQPGTRGGMGLILVVWVHPLGGGFIGLMKVLALFTFVSTVPRPHRCPPDRQDTGPQPIMGGMPSTRKAGHANH